MKKLVYSSLWFATAFCVAGFLFFKSAQLRAAHYVCSMVTVKYFEPTPALQNWSSACRELASSFNYFTSKKQIVRSLQKHLLQMGVSHLFLYEPQEERLLWQGIDKTNGLRLRMIEGYFVVYEVLPDSPAFRAGFQVGDAITHINGNLLLNTQQVEHSSGVFSVIRKNLYLKLNCEVEEIKLDDQPNVRTLENTFNQIGVLKISNFRSEYFEKENWNQLIAKTQIYQKLIIDLRDNPGGNFVAMLRMLSSFVCAPQEIGFLKMPRHQNPNRRPIRDVLKDVEHFQDLEQNGELSLKTFEGYTCYSKPIVVLIDHSSASVTEIFADAIRQLKRGRVLGERSSGQVLLSVWYNVPDLGANYSLSIPESIYESSSGERFEGFGVVPDKYLEYKLSDAAQGLDSWLLQSK